MHPVVHEVLRAVLAADTGPELAGNVDPFRFPPGHEEPPRDDGPLRLADVLSQAAGIEFLYDLLEQAADRELLVRVLAFRVLGHRRVRMPLSLEELTALVERARSMRTAERTAQVGLLGMEADDYDLTELGYPIRLRAYVEVIVQTFEIEQYRCTGEPAVSAQRGDVVIDGGAYWGDTALYFAHLAGPEGRVVSFEFERSNLDALDHNLSLNPELASRVDVVQAALSDRAGEEVAVLPYGPGTRVTTDGGAVATTDTVDALLERGDVERVDFIKLDVEGSELAALRGAEATLRRFRPRLAVAVYHRPEDLSAIPAYLAGLDVGYRFRLAHTTMHAEETILFATTAR